ncbi:unnamed protein product [Orchesella dallaii]|uniref:Uncharacterized protein n=1 Tax=Orchesella dallaii TaxID=48710 RepID=A0ABP1QTU4_9HEXA
MADTKSIKSGISGDSSWDSKSMGSKSRSEAKRQRHMAKLKKRMENLPTRKLLFRPKIYESWREGDVEDEIQERERLLKDIAAKEQRLLERRRAKKEEGGGEEEYSDSDEENQVIKALERLKSRKQREEEYKLRLEEEQKRRDEEKKLELDEKIMSELQNPSVYGWFYTDGYYDNAPYFGVREDLVPQYLEQQEQWNEKWAEKYPETFTAQYKRFFWPPKLILKNRMFRTRGSYLDFPEVIADWPKAVEVNFEKDVREYITNRHELFGVDEAQKEEDERALEEARLLAEQEAAGLITQEEAERRRTTAALIKQKAQSGMVFDLDSTSQSTDANQWYYDDEDGQFFPKKLGFDIEYYFDGVNHCWRHKKKRGKYKSENQQTPYDYYFDDSTRNFVPREEYKGMDEIVYDQKSCVYRIHLIGLGSKPPKKDRKTKSGVTLIDLPDLKDFDEKDVESGKKLNSPKSYYFDEEFGKWILKYELPDSVNSVDISWDENGKRYSRKFEGNWRGLTGYSPDDYYWQDRTRKFIPKPARQSESFRYFAQDGVWRKTDEAGGLTNLHSEDISRWYFDEFEGQFKPKDFSTGSNARYIQGRYSKIWRSVAPPKSNMYPEEFYYDRHKKRWLPRAVRLEMLKNAEVARQKNIMQGSKRGTLWDIKQNEKDTKPEDFYFDDVEGVYLKKKANEEYIFDDQDKCWKMEKLKDKPKQTRFSHDYYFDVEEKNFLLKNPSSDYNYDQKYHVWKKGNDDLSKLSPNPEEFCYDVTLETWGRKEGGGIQYDPMLCLNVKPNTDPNHRSPDDYYFHEVDGRFYPKENEEAMAGMYVYDAGDGAWRHKDVRGPSKSGLAPRNFFFDDTTKTFKLKVHGRDKDYFMDKSNKIFRSIVASGKTKSGFKPSDFIWNGEFKSFIPSSVLKKNRVEAVFDEMPKWDPLRQYNKPWMSQATMRNPDAAPAPPKEEESKGSRGGSLFSKDRKKKNRVEPAPERARSQSPSSVSVSSSQSTKKK